jgi:glycosyltransferase involved in cell wall biosynthesis
MHIHMLSNSLRMNSGFSIVAKNLAIGLKKLGHQVTFTGMQTAYMSEWVNNIEVLPIQVYYVDDLTQFMMTLDRIKPDIVLSIFQMDMGTNNPFTRVFPKTIIYCPAEGRNIPQGMTNDLLQIKMDGGLVVAQCQYGKSEMKLALGGLDVQCIYHGYDPNIFKPLNLNDDEKIRYCYYKTEDGQANSNPISLHQMGCYDCKLNNKEQTNCPHYKEEQVSILRFVNGKWKEESINIHDLPSITKNVYVLGFVGQNIGVRKRIERLLNAYSIFIKCSKQIRDRTALHLHTKPIAIDGINLIKIIQDLGLSDNIMFSYGTHRSSGWTENGMNILYNTFDVNVSASSSEGFGLPILESMTAGIPNIGPDCSSFTELIGKDEKTRRGLLASIGEWQMIQDGSMRALVNEENLARQMKELYQNKDLYKLCSKNAIEFSSNYTWEKICSKWDDLLKTMK